MDFRGSLFTALQVVDQIFKALEEHSSKSNPLQVWFNLKETSCGYSELGPSVNLTGEDDQKMHLRGTLLN